MTTVYSTHSRYIEHDLPRHPERADRVRAAWQHLEDAGLSARMLQMEPQLVEESLLLSVHTRAHLDLLRRLGEQQRTVMIDNDTYFNPKSYTIARLSAGGVVCATSMVLNGKAHNGLAVVRPPGHHAMPTHAMGFCLLGNIAIAARYAQQVHGIQRVMIVDFDVHHGNGTEAMFYDDPGVLVLSIHQYGGFFYPGTGALHDTGSDRGAGYTINVPLVAGHGDESYARIFEQVVLPAAERFQPELLLVSAGFDAHWSDPLAGMRLSLTGYAQMTRTLIEIAQQFCAGRIIFVIEGGYDLEVLGSGIVNIAHALLGDDTVVDPLGIDTRHNSPMIQPLLDQIRAIHRL